MLPLFLGLRTFSREGHQSPGDDFDSVLSASREYLREILSRDSDARTVVGADDAEALVGYLVAVIRPPNPLTSSGAVRTGSIDELFLVESARGSGAAGMLMRAVEAWFRAERVERAEVGAYAWNSEALDFYERHGFSPWTVTLTKSL